MGDTINKHTHCDRVYISDLEDTAAPSPVAMLALWVSLAIAAFVVFFVG